MTDGQVCPEHHAMTDASGSFGCGAWWGHRWLQYQWPAGMETWSIAVKELIPVVMAIVVWGHHCQGTSVLINSDNEAVANVLNTGYAKDQQLMHLLRCAFFITVILR